LRVTLSVDSFLLVKVSVLVNGFADSKGGYDDDMILMFMKLILEYMNFGKKLKLNILR
jgi:hypothetical protein